MNYSLTSLRHQRGRNSTDPLPVNACTNSCANSALLYCIGRNYRSVLRAGIVTLVLRRQRSSNKEHLNVTTKSEREEGVRVGNRDAKSSNIFFLGLCAALWFSIPGKTPFYSLFKTLI